MTVQSERRQAHVRLAEPCPSRRPGPLTFPRAWRVHRSLGSPSSLADLSAMPTLHRLGCIIDIHGHDLIRLDHRSSPRTSASSVGSRAVAIVGVWSGARGARGCAAPPQERRAPSPPAVANGTTSPAGGRREPAATPGGCIHDSAPVREGEGSAVAAHAGHRCALASRERLGAHWRTRMLRSSRELLQ
jgi:hypothetical protein